MSSSSHLETSVLGRGRDGAKVHWEELIAVARIDQNGERKRLTAKHTGTGDCTTVLQMSLLWIEWPTGMFASELQRAASRSRGRSLRDARKAQGDERLQL